ncbi:MAG TPA: bifunctional diaminohydroxyphosphoribosylaminopyrimidine deaminase/5-amino-6-(5-phosphoribosylamino)uracil reductase RibD [Kiritimatiellia bacterium]|nr:bifunctional diaminohydroxyphosphoribosylaminopyrimidine deaminase/5-amino-6-(5-phosphoribosylamino)uracil reductase RibD [Kiritimatiellia bacterium]HRZ12913.1 bifunctional diaminohydroxyphosphoribosylaminopyrimidine deaminase/5-amino-6-(5-phosphoribosylamino)uracil reductase RibD [Kiritimatiellia bacterium]HSA18477.1 bifunctional diaminohydroxyphosphoribosylaminopyrimidine deaminase/5-amino-6-(5-phosphoribosylamino)uracil reductase RibD [Kiritimatiellia bacterium]
MKHELYMRRALDLGRRGEGLTRPNPAVGAVVVRNGRIVGEGWHRKAGGPHAEVYALRRAGKRARGATLYVTLEPCCTQGRTPPCTEAILKAGIAEVIVGTRDPNPAHAGRGLRLLRRAGVRVVAGVLEGEARALLAPFAKWILARRPFVTLKMGMTLDGRIADETGASRWITGPAARRKVQTLRRRVDGVLVGKNTLLKDNPSLLPVPAKGRKPWRIVLAPDGRVPASAKVLSDGHADQTLLTVSNTCASARVKALQAAGARVLRIRAKAGRLPAGALLDGLGQLGLLHVLCEGGGELAASLIEGGLVDNYLFFISPSFLGGRATAVVGGRGWRMAGRPRLRFISVERCGPDIMVKALPE